MMMMPLQELVPVSDYQEIIVTLEVLKRSEGNRPFVQCHAV
jgi:hypothetical protein